MDDITHAIKKANAWNESSAHIINAISTSITKAHAQADSVYTTSISNIQFPPPVDWFRTTSKHKSCHHEINVPNYQSNTSDLVNIEEDCDVEILRNKFLKALVVIADLKAKLAEKHPVNLQSSNEVSSYENIVLTRDRQELCLAKLRYELYHLKKDRSRVDEMIHHQQQEHDTLHLKNRLMTMEIINTRDIIYNLRQENRDLSRSNIKYESQLFSQEDHLARQYQAILDQQHIISNQQHRIEEMSIRIRQQNMLYSHKQVKLQENLHMQIEDLSGRLMMQEDHRRSLDEQLLSMHEVKRSVDADHHNLQHNMNKLQYTNTTLTAKLNAMEKKASSLSQDLRKRLKSLAPLNRELYQVKNRLDEVIHERDAFKEAMTLAINQLPSSMISHQLRASDSSKLHQSSQQQPYMSRAWDLSPSCFECHAPDIDTVDMILFPPDSPIHRLGNKDT